MGRPATPCRSARPHTDPDADRCRRLLLQIAVERRLGEKSAGRLQNLIGPAKLLDLSLQRLEAFALVGTHAGTYAAIDFRALHPPEQCINRTANLRRDGLGCCPLGGILVTVLLHQAHGAFTDFRGKLVVLAHGSIFSRIGASSKPGAIQAPSQAGQCFMTKSSKIWSGLARNYLIFYASFLVQASAAGHL